MVQEVGPEGKWSQRRLAAHVAALAIALGVLAAAAVAASRLTSAYWVQVPFVRVKYVDRV